ncbi:MAG TPA: GreA/GreB family elongation factor [Haliangiales bacterium]|nr:GreA/GreB family elongation factor [Haliangiales bacterium]
MSKAFTSEEDAGLDVPVPARRRDPTRLTRYGARLLAARLDTLDPDDTAAGRIREILDDAQVMAPTGRDTAAFGARVRFRDGDGHERAVVLVSTDEVGVVPEGVSMATPLGQALVGVAVGDTIAVESPREDELTILAIDWPE